MAEKERKLGIWGKFLTLWVALCIGAGVGLGHLFPQLSDMLARLEVADVSIPIAILLFAMIYPIMVQISWAEIIKAARSPKPIGLTLIANWAIKPFTMAFFAWLFLSVIFGRFLDSAEIEQYRAGPILLGVCPLHCHGTGPELPGQRQYGSYPGDAHNQLAHHGRVVMLLWPFYYSALPVSACPGTPLPFP
jgi:ACR3 family arsenite efflux pump ArsB